MNSKLLIGFWIICGCASLGSLYFNWIAVSFSMDRHNPNEKGVRQMAGSSLFLGILGFCGDLSFLIVSWDKGSGYTAISFIVLFVLAIVLLISYFLFRHAD